MTAYLVDLDEGELELVVDQVLARLGCGRGRFAAEEGHLRVGHGQRTEHRLRAVLILAFEVIAQRHIAQRSLLLG